MFQAALGARNSTYRVVQELAEFLYHTDGATVQCRPQYIGSYVRCVARQPRLLYTLHDNPTNNVPPPVCAPDIIPQMHLVIGWNPATLLAS